MTNPNIERDKVEEIRKRANAAIKAAFVPLGVKELVLDLLSRLTVSEKRAEDLEFRLADDQFWKLKAEQAESERNEARSSLVRVRDEALEEAAKVCDDEKDEFRRIVDEGEGAPLKVCALSCANVAFALACRIRDLKARSALSPHPERENG